MTPPQLRALIRERAPHGLIWKDDGWYPVNADRFVVYDDPSQSWPAISPTQLEKRLLECERCHGRRWIAADDYRGEFASATRPCPSCTPIWEALER